MICITLALTFQLLAMRSVLVSLVEAFKRAVGSLTAVALGRAVFREKVGPRELVVEATNGRSLDVLETLRGSGVALRSFQLQGPTLEEMFLSVVRGGRRER